MSTAMLIVPAPFQIETVQLPAAHVTGTMTRFGTALCGLMLRLDACGLGVPVNAVKTVGTDGAIPVKLKTTAVTPVPGTGLPPPFTLNVSVAPDPIGEGPLVLQRVVGTPPPGARVSQMRTGADAAV